MESIVRSLHFYPLKSARGISVPSMDIVQTGPRYDREWMLIKASGQFISQRTHPILSQIRTRITSSELIFSFEGQEDIYTPLGAWGLEKKEVDVFGKKTIAFKTSSNEDEWFSEVLGEKVFLVRSPEKDRRATSGKHGPITPIHFSDGYPLLLTNQSSLKKLEKKLGQPLTMDRFRPNIVIEKASEDIEDTWKDIKIGDLSFLCAKACTRCSIIDIDPMTGTRDPDKKVTRELKKYRSLEKQVLFGINLIHHNEGSIHVGDSIKHL